MWQNQIEKHYAISACGVAGIAETFPLFQIYRGLSNIFLSRGDRQMTEIFVSGTEIFSDAKMTESPYE